MDLLCFKAVSKKDVLSELHLHEEITKDDGRYFNGVIFQGTDYIFSWIGKVVDEWEEIYDSESRQNVLRPKSFKEGFYFNIWVDGQEAMDRFYNMNYAEQVAPSTPDLTLF